MQGSHSYILIENMSKFTLQKIQSAESINGGVWDINWGGQAPDSIDPYWFGQIGTTANISTNLSAVESYNIVDINSGAVVSTLTLNWFTPADGGQGTVLAHLSNSSKVYLHQMDGTGNITLFKTFLIINS